MMVFRRLTIAAAMAFAAPALAQAPVGQPAAAEAPATAAQAAKPAEVLPAYKPVPGVGQPEPAGLGLQPQVTANGERALWFHDAILMPLITAISLFVLALLIWTIARYSRRANPTPSKTSHNTVIEVIWTLVPVLILVAIAVPSIGLLAAQYKPAGKDAITIKAIGNQWYWTYEYPDNGGFELTSNMLTDAQAKAAGEPRLLGVDQRVVVPVGRVVRLLTTSNDVIHSWAIPAFWTKMDAVPGRVNETSFKVDKPGVYYGQCSELCGARHSFMPIAVEAVSQADFDRWVVSKGGTVQGVKPGGVGQQPIAAGGGGQTLQAPAVAGPAPAATTAAPTTTPGTTAATAPSNAAPNNNNR